MKTSKSINSTELLYCRRLLNNCRHSKSQQATSHSDHTRHRPSSDLLCKDGTISFLYTRNEEDEQQKVAATSSLNQLHIQWLGRSSKRRRVTTAVTTSSSQYIRRLPTSHHFTRLVDSAEYQTSSCWATTPNNLITWVILDIKKQEPDEDTHHQCLTCYKFKVHVTQ